ISFAPNTAPRGLPVKYVVVMLLLRCSPATASAPNSTAKIVEKFVDIDTVNNPSGSGRPSDRSSSLIVPTAVPNHPAPKLNRATGMSSAHHRLTVKILRNSERTSAVTIRHTPRDCPAGRAGGRAPTAGAAPAGL